MALDRVLIVDDEDLTRAARLLDISRDALRYKMKKFHLQEAGD